MALIVTYTCMPSVLSSAPLRWRTLFNALTLSSVVLLTGGLIHAAPQPASVFSDHMVLQRDRSITVWGQAKAGETIKISFCGHDVSVTTDERGQWTAQLPAIPAGGPYEMTIAGESTVTLRDILVGDVWLCSGQSNMFFLLADSQDGAAALANADNPQIRLLRVDTRTSPTPQTRIAAKWEPCTKETASRFSAVAYYFATDLQKTIKVPIGLIEAAFGGTPIEAWMTGASYQSTPLYPEVAQRWSRILAAYPEERAKYDKLKEEYPRLVEQAKAQGTPAPPAPKLPEGVPQHVPTYLYNAMIAPLVPYGLRGVLWYQGEHNFQQYDEYAIWMPALIRGWREVWKQGNIPFLFVQLPNFMARDSNPTDNPWTRLREAQGAGLAEPETAMVTTIDLGEATNIHPKNKKPVGERLALAARAVAYGEKLVYSGPTYDSMRVQGGEIVIKFKSVGGGLVAQGGEPLKGFAVAGMDQRFFWAEAKIDGGSVIVKSDKVLAPVAVRYAWADNPLCNLYNADGLPAVPFRTDTFEKAAGWTSVGGVVVRANQVAHASEKAVKWILTSSPDWKWANLIFTVPNQNWTNRSVLHFRFCGGTDADQGKKLIVYFYNRGARTDREKMGGVGTVQLTGGSEWQDAEISLGAFARDEVNQLCFSVNGRDLQEGDHIFCFDDIRVDNEPLHAKP